MSVFGLTPIDTALSALGLNYCQVIVDFIFRQTPLASVALTAGFLLSVARLVRSGSYRPLLVFFALALGIGLLLVPQRQEGTVKSALEQYSGSTQSSQALKDQLINSHYIPVLLSFLGQASDALMIGVIHALDAFSPEGGRYLSAPFAAHRHCLQTAATIGNGLSDADLEQRLDTFLQDYYAPALGLLRHDLPFINPADVWPGDEHILSNYSSDAKNQWHRLDQDVRAYCDARPDLNERVRTDLGRLTGAPPDDIAESFVKAIVQQRLLSLARIPVHSVIWQSASWALAIFPYMCGIANAMLYMAFPFCVLALVLGRRPAILLRYSKMWIWIKSWMLSGALSFYASFAVARMQAQTAAGPFWAWEQPYFCLAAVAGMVLLPVITLIFINKGGSAWSVSGGV